MTKLSISAMQTRLHLAGFPLVSDGHWGPKSAAACQSYLRSLMPSPNPWPASDSASLTRYFGQAADESNLVNLPVGEITVKYDGTRVKTIRCHKQVSASLARILAAISASPHAGVLHYYAGCYYSRPMRNSTRISTHAWGIAIDLAPNWNANLTPWPAEATMPLEVMEIFAREGWLPAGAFWLRDAMHFQATR